MHNIYSHGDTLKEVIGWPHALPIPVSMDHGMSIRAEPEVVEMPDQYRLHLAWSEWRTVGEKRRKSTQIVRIEHPWVSFRRERKIGPTGKIQGSVFFFPHSVPGKPLPIDNIHLGLEELRLGPRPLRPAAIMVMMHDVHLGLHESLRKHGLPLLTAGNTSSPLFVHRFYEIVRNFSAGASTSVGSQSFYLEEMGVPFALVGDPPEYPPIPEDQLGPGDSERYRNWIRTFALGSSSSQTEKTELLESALGLSGAVSHRELRQIFIRELIVRFFPILRAYVVKFAQTVANRLRLSHSLRGRGK